MTLVIAFAPGSIIDYVGRAIADDLATELSQPVRVETKLGGGGVVAGLAVAKAPRDGYTLLLTGIGPACLRPLIDKYVATTPRPISHR